MSVSSKLSVLGISWKISFYSQCNPKHTKIHQLQLLTAWNMLNKCRNNVLQYGYDSKKIESVMACFGIIPSPCRFNTVLHAAVYRVNTEGRRASWTWRSIVKRTRKYKHVLLSKEDWDSQGIFTIRPIISLLSYIVERASQMIIY